MLICICGKEKTNIIDELKSVYKDQILVCDYFNISFNTIIENDPVYYKIMNEGPKTELSENTVEEFNNKVLNSIDKKRKKFSEYINYAIYNKIKLLLANNNDKIIILKRDNFIIPDVDKTEFFKVSDLKILVENNDEKVDSRTLFAKNNIYNKDDFDIVINSKEKIDVKKLVKL